MADDRIDPLLGVHNIAPVQRHDQPEPQIPARRGLAIRGHITAVVAGRPHAGEHHQLDVSIGGNAYTEIIIRVPNDAYGHLEGRDATLHVDPA